MISAVGSQADLKRQKEEAKLLKKRKKEAELKRKKQAELEKRRKAEELERKKAAELVKKWIFEYFFIIFGSRDTAGPCGIGLNRLVM